LKAITKVPSKSPPLLLDGENLRAAGKEILVSILPTRIRANHFPLGFFDQFHPLPITKTIHRKFHHRTTGQTVCL
jgi:hypothetical protein